MKLSLCYIVKDEMLNLPHSILQMRGKVDEICIVDTGSTDGTKEYARAVADRYKDFKWCDDFSAARNASLDLATGDWLLVLDADEFINEDIRYLIEDADGEAYRFTIQNFLQDPRWMKDPICLYGDSIRLFINKFRYEGIVHNKLKCEKSIPVPIAVVNFQFQERYRITWKSEQNKKLMDRKIKAQGLNHLNCVHYGDIYRKLFFWKGQINDGLEAIQWFEKAQKFEHNLKIQNIIEKLKIEVENVKFSKENKQERLSR